MLHYFKRAKSMFAVPVVLAGMSLWSAWREETMRTFSFVDTATGKPVADLLVEIRIDSKTARQNTGKGGLVRATLPVPAPRYVRVGMAKAITSALAR